MSIFDDLGAEQERLEKILSGLDEAQWASASAADGWTIADVVLHLAQSEEAAAATATHGTLRGGLGVVAGETMDARADAAVRAERAAPAEIFGRWQRARQAALAAMRDADPDQPVQWMVGTVKPATLATTRLAEHWAHGLDIAGPLGADFPDTDRLRAHRLAGAPNAAVRAEPGRRAGRPGAVRADRAGRRTGVAVRAGRRRVGHHGDGRGVLPGRGAAAGSGAVRSCRPAGRTAPPRCAWCARTRRRR